MQHEKKNFVYLQRSNQIQGTATSVRHSQSDGHFLCPERCEIYTAVCEPCVMAIMVTAAPCNGLSGRKHHTAFSFVVHRSNITKMKTKKFQSKGLYAPVVGFSENDYSTSLQLDGEQWKTLLVLGRPYEISNYGRIKSKELTESYILNGIEVQRTRKPKILRCVSDKYGYLRVTFTKRNQGNSKMESYFLHRLVALAWIGKSDQQVDHLNCNKHDNRACNLEYVSHTENMRRAWKNGLMTITDQTRNLPNHGEPKFTKNEAEEIRSQYKPYKFTIKMLCEKYGCCERTIRDVLKGLKAYSTEKGGQQ